jgi:hypothetical protein
LGQTTGVVGMGIKAIEQAAIDAINESKADKAADVDTIEDGLLKAAVLVMQVQINELRVLAGLEPVTKAQLRAKVRSKL